MPDIREILGRAEKVKPIAESNGRKIVSFDDYRSVATVANMNGKDLGGTDWNPDGSMASTKTSFVATNTDYFYDNRFKKVGDKYYVVKDHMAIDGAQRGQLPYTSIQGYVIAKDKNKIVCEKMVLISADEFLADYTLMLDKKSMALVLEAIQSANVEVGTEKLEF